MRVSLRQRQVCVFPAQLSHRLPIITEDKLQCKLARDEEGITKKMKGTPHRSMRTYESVVTLRTYLDVEYAHYRKEEKFILRSAMDSMRGRATLPAWQHIIGWLRLGVALCANRASLALRVSASTAHSHNSHPLPHHHPLSQRCVPDEHDAPEEHQTEPGGTREPAYRVRYPAVGWCLGRQQHGSVTPRVLCAQPAAAGGGWWCCACGVCGLSVGCGRTASVRGRCPVVPGVVEAALPTLVFLPDWT
jgi:hypothetical protein